MAKQPDYVQELLKNIPVQWDESRLVEGFPGKEVVMARRKGEQWYVVGINGENGQKSFQLQLDFIDDSAEGFLITDGEDGFSRTSISKEDRKNLKVEVKAYGGFVMKLEE